MKLPRPSIPIWVGLTVARRQLRWSDMGLDDITKRKRGLGLLLRFAMDALKAQFNSEKLDLDHDPPLGAREKIWKDDVIIGYIPAANDPDYLIYRVRVDHKTKTNIRGTRGQHPDRVLIVKQRRLEERDGLRPARKGKHKPHRVQPPKRKWPSRSFPKGRKFKRKKS